MISEVSLKLAAPSKVSILAMTSVCCLMSNYNNYCNISSVHMPYVQALVECAVFTGVFLYSILYWVSQIKVSLFDLI